VFVRAILPLCVAPYCCFYVHLGVIDAADNFASSELDWGQGLPLGWGSCMIYQEGQNMLPTNCGLAFWPSC
jgi:hypothetical protein